MKKLFLITILFFMPSAMAEGNWSKEVDLCVERVSQQWRNGELVYTPPGGSALYRSCLEEVASHRFIQAHGTNEKQFRKHLNNVQASISRIYQPLYKSQRDKAKLNPDRVYENFLINLIENIE